MQRRSVVLAALAGLGMLAGSPVQAMQAQDHQDISRVQMYLNNIHTLKARFTQVAPDGAITNGTAWLWRPGRMRFEYDRPSPLLLVANNGKLVFRDNQLDQTSTIPLSNSPLGILLADHIDLTGGGVTVQSITRPPGEIELTLARSASPADGQLTLIFSDAPLELRSWVVTDAQHNETKVTLTDLDTGAASFDPRLFAYHDPNLPAPAAR